MEIIETTNCYQCFRESLQPSPRHYVFTSGWLVGERKICLNSVNYLGSGYFISAYGLPVIHFYYYDVDRQEVCQFTWTFSSEVKKLQLQGDSIVVEDFYGTLRNYSFVRNNRHIVFDCDNKDL